MGVRASCLALAALAISCGGREAEGADATGAIAACTDPDRMTLGATYEGVGELAIDATDIYWVNFGPAQHGVDVTIQRNSKNGGAPAMFAAPCTDILCHPTFVLDDSTIYYTGLDTSGVSVNSLAKEWGKSAVLATGLDTSTEVVGVDANDVYVAASNGVSSLPKAGGALVPIATGADVVFLGIDASNVYWTSAAAPGALYATPKSGGATTMLAALPGVIGVLASDTENVYVGGGSRTYPADGALGAIYVVPKQGAAPRVLATGFTSWTVVIAGRTLYAGQSPVVAIDVASGAVTRTVVTGMEGGLISMAVDENFIYVATNGDLGGAIRRACRFATTP